jgi:hypothetical protein
MSGYRESSFILYLEWGSRPGHFVKMTIGEVLRFSVQRYQQLGLTRRELAFALKPTLRFTARLSPALQMNLVRAMSHFLLTR